MAYLPENEMDRQRRLQEQGQGGQQIASGASGVITGGNQTGAQQAGKGPTKSGSWTNLNAYLDANKPQAAQLGQNVANNVSNQAEQAKTNLGQTQTQFKTAVDQGSVTRDQNFVNQAVSNPTEFVKDKNNVSKFAGIRDAVFKGPQAIQDVDGYAGASQAVKNANQAVENTKTEAGRFSLVQDQFKRPTYNRGQQRLDQMLLQNTPESRTQFAEVQNRYSGLMDQLNQAQTQAQEYATQRKAETEAARNDARNALGQMDDPTTPQNEAAGAMGAFQTDLQGRTKTQREREQDVYNRLQTQLGQQGDSLELDADLLERLGLQDGARLYDTDLSKFAPEFNPDNINEQTVASADDYAKYAALSELAGVEPTFLYDGKRAATARGVEVDRDLLNQNVTNAQNRYNELDGRRADVNQTIASMVNDRFSGVNTLGIDWSKPQDAETIRKFLNTFKQEAAAADAGWLADAESGRETNQWAQNYRQIRDWINQYDSLRPTRTVKKKA